MLVILRVESVISRVTHGMFLRWFYGVLCYAMACVNDNSANKCRSYEYHVIQNVNVTWSEASELCDLAIFADAVAWTCVSQYINEFNTQIWAAGLELNSNWTWLSGTTYRGFRVAPHADEQCASISVTGVYSTRPCKQTLTSYICRLPPANCQKNTTSADCHQVYYSAITCVVLCRTNNHYTWFSARNKCLHGNGDLISFDDPEVSTAVIGATEHEFGSTQDVMWIGLLRDPWIWKLPNQTELISYTFWADGEPIRDQTQSNCLALESGNDPLTWRSLDCDTSLEAAICQGASNHDDRSLSVITDARNANRETPWLKNDMTILLFSVASVVVFMLLLIIISLVVCLRNARRINVLLGSRPKTYFDYFDLGFRRKLPTMAQSTEPNRTLVLTNDMLTSPAPCRNVLDNRV